MLPSIALKLKRRVSWVNAASIGLIILFIIALVAYAYVGWFTRYMADDYCMVNSVRDNGLLATQKNLYIGWSGRFSFTFLMSLATLFGPKLVPLLPSVALALWLTVMTWAVFQFKHPAGWTNPFLTSLLLAALVIFATLSDAPSVFEPLYWETGVLTYLVPLILLTFYAGLLKYWHGRKIKEGSSLRLRVILSAGLAFIAAGFSETYAVLQTSLLVIATAFCLVAGKASKKALLPLLIAGLLGSVIAVAVLVAAPGNKNRQANFPPHPGWATVIKSSFEKSFEFVAYPHKYPDSLLTRAGAFLLPALLALNLSGREKETVQPEHDDKGPLKWLLPIFPLAGYALIVLCFAPAFYAMSRVPPPRTLFIPQFVLTCTLSCWGYLCGLFLKRTYLANAPKGVSLLGLGYALVVVMVAFSAISTARSTFALAPKARALAALWDKQEQEIRAARSQGLRNLTVTLAYNLGGTDLMESNSESYVNRCVAVYYEVDSITAKPDIEGAKIMYDAEEK